MGNKFYHLDNHFMLVAPWYERSLMVRWELFLIPASAPQLV